MVSFQLFEREKLLVIEIVLFPSVICATSRSADPPEFDELLALRVVRADELDGVLEAAAPPGGVHDALGRRLRAAEGLPAVDAGGARWGGHGVSVDRGLWCGPRNVSHAGGGLVGDVSRRSPRASWRSCK